MKNKIISLLTKYENTRQNLYDFTTAYYDAMGYDISGYWEDIDELDESEVIELENKIKNFEALTKCYAKIDFKYC